MKKLFLSFFMCMAAAWVFALDVTELRTEDYHNPVGIDKSVIHFSWQLQSEQTIRAERPPAARKHISRLA